MPKSTDKPTPPAVATQAPLSGPFATNEELYRFCARLLHAVATGERVPVSLISTLPDKAVKPPPRRKKTRLKLVATSSPRLSESRSRHWVRLACDGGEIVRQPNLGGAA